MRGFFDGNGDGIGRLPRADREARLPAVARRRLHLAAADVPLAAARRRLRHRRLLRDPPRLRHASTTSSAFIDAGAPARHPRDRRPGDEPHLERPPLVPGGALGPDTRRSATGTSGPTPTSRYADARIIFVDTESSNWTWDPVRGQYYWHRFFDHQPDLNYDNPEVQEAMLDVAALLARPRPRRLPPRRRPLPVRARGHQLREPRRRRTPT